MKNLLDIYLRNKFIYLNYYSPNSTKIIIKHGINYKTKYYIFVHWLKNNQYELGVVYYYAK